MTKIVPQTIVGIVSMLRIFWAFCLLISAALGAAAFPAYAAGDLLVARGIAVYPEVTQRAVSLRVPTELAAKLKGPLRIRYSEDREMGGATIDEADRAVK